MPQPTRSWLLHTADRKGRNNSSMSRGFMKLSWGPLFFPHLAACPVSTVAYMKLASLLQDQPYSCLATSVITKPGRVRLDTRRRLVHLILVSSAQVQSEEAHTHTALLLSQAIGLSALSIMYKNQNHKTRAWKVLEHR